MGLRKEGLEMAESCELRVEIKRKRSQLGRERAREKAEEVKS
jgi:hypothetical protein